MIKPLVSIVIATFNRAQEIGATLAAVRLQDYPSIEIIIVNDGSADGTKDVLDRENGIVVIHNVSNLGLQKSLNIGCSRAQGKYIARLDDHDHWIDYQKISKQVAILEKNPQVGVVGTAIQLGNRTIINPLSDKQIRDQMLFRCPFSHVTIMMRRDLFEKVGGYDENLKYSEDWDLWMKIGLHADFLNLPIITTTVKEEAGSLTDQFYISQSQQNQQMLNKYSRFYPRKNLACGYQYFVRIFFKIVKKDSNLHRFFTKIYTKMFCK